MEIKDISMCCGFGTKATKAGLAQEEVDAM